MTSIKEELAALELICRKSCELVQSDKMPLGDYSRIMGWTSLANEAYLSDMPYNVIYHAMNARRLARLHGIEV